MSGYSSPKAGKPPYLLLLCPAAAFGLGVWQVHRRNWKLGVIENIDRRLKEDPVFIEPPRARKEFFDDYQPLKFRGRYDFSHQMIIGPRSLITDNVKHVNKDKFRFGGTGYLVITPFVLENSDKRILVNRGWVPYETKDEYLKNLDKSSTLTEICGLFRTSEPKPMFNFVKHEDERNLVNRDVERIAQSLNAEEIYIDLTNKDRDGDFPVAGQTRIQLRNEHLQYSLTWFALSIATAGFWWFRYVK